MLLIAVGEILFLVDGMGTQLAHVVVDLKEESIDRFVRLRSLPPVHVLVALDIISI